MKSASTLLDHLLGPDECPLRSSKSAHELKCLGDGATMHSEVSPECWCVTKDDLKHLRKLIREAVEQGTIEPTAFDSFDPCDRAIGPNMYTINEQFIKPITARAGKMSWALMCHKKGLKCDLFITHAWAEGIYEFIDKVLHAWPRGAKRAYCCLLSNPQNLDISMLIKSPKDSPFAKALSSASVMLVVPNKSGSIYARLWCAYEAFLAWQQGKTIVVARAPLQMACRISCLLCFFALGVIAVYKLTQLAVVYGPRDPAVFRPHGMDPLRWWFDYTLLAALLSCTVRDMGGPRFWVISSCLNCIGMLCAGASFQCTFLTLDEITDAATTFLQIGAFGVLFVLADVDISRLTRARLEAEQLRTKFVTIQSAQCSCPGDQEAIMVEIAHAIEQVDSMIAQLLRAGMSTPSLTQLSSHGVDVEDAGYVSFSNAWVMWIIWQSVSVWGCAGHPLLQALSYSQALCWALALPWMPLDRLTFAAHAVVKFVLIMIFFAFSLGIPKLPRELICGVTITSGTAAFMCSLIGPAYLIGLRFFGPAIVRIIYMRSISDFRMTLRLYLGSRRRKMVVWL